MKILKPGIVQENVSAKPRRFRCVACRCEFEANAGEYILKEAQTLIGIPMLQAVGTCPECQSEAKEMVMR